MSFDDRDPRDWDRAPEGFQVRKVKREELPLRYPYLPGEFTLGGSVGVRVVYWVKHTQDFDQDSFAEG